MIGICIYGDWKELTRRNNEGIPEIPFAFFVVDLLEDTGRFDRGLPDLLERICRSGGSSGGVREQNS